MAYALDKYPHVADRIERVWWMGGALRVRGNVYQPHTDGSAEWNAFWDPAALAVVWNSSVPLTLVPLDGTNKVSGWFATDEADEKSAAWDACLHDRQGVESCRC